jgi:hypothetical protein
MRPYIFHGYTPGWKLWDNFVNFEGDKYSFTSSRDTDVFLFLKPFLLYSHGICFLDSLPGLLDFFRLSPKNSDYEKDRLPGVAQLLLEYVKIADLIRHRIVVGVTARKCSECTGSCTRREHKAFEPGICGDFSSAILSASASVNSGFAAAKVRGNPTKASITVPISRFHGLSSVNVPDVVHLEHFRAVTPTG